MDTTTLKAQSHCVYSTHYHLVMATADLRKVLTRRVLDRFEALARERTEAWGGELLELRADPDYVHLHIELPPKVAVAEFTNALKTGTSRRLRSEFARLKGQKQLWSQSYCVIGGEQAPMDVIKAYLESQGRSEAPNAPARPVGRSALAAGQLSGLSEAATAFLGNHPAAARLAIAAGLEAAASQYEAGNGRSGAEAAEPVADAGGGEQDQLAERSSAERSSRARESERPGKQRDVVSVSQAAERFGVSKPTIYNWIHSGAITARKGSGRGLEIPVAQLAKQEKSALGRAGPKRAPRAGTGAARTPAVGSKRA
jgi:putative transposase